MVLREDLVKRLQFHLSVGHITDPVLSSITEEELEDLLKGKAKFLGLSYPNFDEDQEEGLMLLVRREIYWKMALVSAPLYEMQMGDLRVSKQVRFEHYMVLVNKVDSEYKDLTLSNPYRIKINVGETTVNKPYTIRKNYNNYIPPIVELVIDKCTVQGINCSVAYSKLNPKDFVRLSVYTSEESLLDEYAEETFNLKEAIHCLDIRDVHKTLFRVNKKCKMITVALELTNGMKVYTECEVKLER